MWLDHPSYTPARDRVIEYLRSDSYRFRRLKPVLFLCGAARSKPRDTLRDYLRKHVPDVSVFYAETVWEHIAAVVGNALEMESDLAALADLLLVIVESPGTFAELGAFSLSDPLRKKMLPIVDEPHRGTTSFISTGPLRWIDHDSAFAPTIYVPLSRILEAADEIEARIKTIPRKRTVKVTDLAASPKHLLFFLCDLISVIHSATAEMVDYYLRAIAPAILTSKISVPTLVGLSVAMGLLRANALTVDGKRAAFLSPTEPNAVEHPFHHTRMQDLESLRAMQVSVLLKVPTAKAVMETLNR